MKGCIKPVSRFWVGVVWDAEGKFSHGVIIDSGVMLDHTIVKPRTLTEFQVLQVTEEWVYSILAERTDEMTPYGFVQVLHTEDENGLFDKKQLTETEVIGLTSQRFVKFYAHSHGGAKNN